MKWLALVIVLLTCTGNARSQAKDYLSDLGYKDIICELQDKDGARCAVLGGERFECVVTNATGCVDSPTHVMCRPTKAAP